MLGFIPLAIAGGALLVNPAIDAAWRSGHITVKDIANYRAFIDRNRLDEAKATRERRPLAARAIRQHRLVIVRRVRDALAFAKIGRTGRGVLPLHRRNLSAIYPYLVALSTRIARDDRPAATLTRPAAPAYRYMTRPQLIIAWQRTTSPVRRAEIRYALDVSARSTVPAPSAAFVPSSTFTPSAPPAASTMPSAAPAFESSTLAPSPGAEGAAFTPADATPATEAPAEGTPTGGGPNWLLIGGLAAVVGVVVVMAKKKKKAAAA